jgi:3,4-dihydroxy 2-butanone 4-phosphate synthase / GTP cyclohydrolase II
MEKRSLAPGPLTVHEAIQLLRKGWMILLYDGEDESATCPVLCLAGQFASESTIRLLLATAKKERLSVVIEKERLEALESATSEGWRERGTPGELAQAVRTLVNLALSRREVQHFANMAVLPAHPGGTRKRQGYREAALDLLRLAGLEPLAVLCETTTVHDDVALYELASRLNYAPISVHAVARYCREHRVTLISETRLPTARATFQLLHYQEIATGQPYLALRLGDLSQGEQPPLLRLHSACVTGEIFGSQRCDCQAQLHLALNEIAREGRGLLLYLPQEGRGIGLTAKLQAYRLQDQGLDTLMANEHLGYPVDVRDYTCALEILQDLAVKQARLLTNNPDKVRALIEGGISVQRNPLEIAPSEHNRFYLQTKYQQLGHLLDMTFEQLR